MNNGVMYRIEAWVEGAHVTAAAKEIIDKKVRDFAIELRVTTAVLSGSAVEVKAEREDYEKYGTGYACEDLLATEPTQEGS